MRANRAGEPGMRFPEIPPQLTTRRVLVTEMVVGSSVADALALDTAAKPRADMADMADKLPNTFLAQTMQDCLFHADPHPGNVLVDAAGDLWLIDHGAIGIIGLFTSAVLGGAPVLAEGTRSPPSCTESDSPDSS